jgi:hypothetical protein
VGSRVMMGDGVSRGTEYGHHIGRRRVYREYEGGGMMRMSRY